MFCRLDVDVNQRELGAQQASLAVADDAHQAHFRPVTCGCLSTSFMRQDDCDILKYHVVNR